jgi:hypothetical protein
MYLPPSPYVLMFFFVIFFYSFRQVTADPSFLYTGRSNIKPAFLKKTKLKRVQTASYVIFIYTDVPFKYFITSENSVHVSLWTMVSKSDSVWWRESMQITLKKAELLFLLVHQQAPSRTTTLFVIPPTKGSSLGIQ